jgi:L-threonylcarbamoyladenylate synthase
MINTDISKAKEILQKNGLVAIPTETVYGLAGNAFSDIAIKKIFELKKRPFYNPLIVHLKAASSIFDVASEIPESAFILAEKFWPGPLTLVLNKKDHISDLISAGKKTVAVRVPKHPLTLALLDQLDFPLAAPSANPFGSISPTSAAHVFNYFGKKIEVILDGGECEKGLESTIIGFENAHPILYRHGSISLEEIKKITGKLGIRTKNDSSPNSPGMLSRHYAPMTDTYLTNETKYALLFALGGGGEYAQLVDLKLTHTIDLIDYKEILVIPVHSFEFALNFHSCYFQFFRFYYFDYFIHQCL